ncbi:MAG: PorP/SprF family type IX secretion system membrane protein [Bacteroidia bacterium]
MKSNIVKSIFLLLFLNYFHYQVYAQDIHFSQFQMAPLIQNPALAGALFDTEALINYKNQWRSVGTPYTTVAASYDMKLNTRKFQRGNFAAGINFFSDKAGDGNLGTTQAALSLAYHLRVAKKSSLGVGLQTGFVQKSIDFSKLTWDAQYDGTIINTSLNNGEPLIGSSKIVPDFSLGMLWKYDNSTIIDPIKTQQQEISQPPKEMKVNIGFAVSHVNQPNISFYNSTTDKLNMKYVVHGSATIGLNQRVALLPGFMAYKQGTLQEFLIGAMARVKFSQETKSSFFNKGASLSIGAYHRAKDAMAICTLFEYSNYAMGISYDINTSVLNNVSSFKGGIELTLRYVTPNPFTTKTAATRL